MAELSTEDRARIHRGLMRYMTWTNRHTYPFNGILKADLLDAINATDTWIDTNQASFVAALPDPFKTASGAALKTLLFCAVAAMRVSVTFAKSIFGEMD